MSMNPKQLREWVIRPTLKRISPDFKYSESAEDILIMVAAHESRLGTYVKQVGGPALGIYQMEPATEQDLHDNFISFHTGALKWYNWFYKPPLEGQSQLVTDLVYATFMARMQFYRDKEPLPVRKKYATEDDYLFALAQYCKRVYNTHLGKAEASDYFLAYKELVLKDD